MKKILLFVAGLIFGLITLGFVCVTTTSMKMLYDENYYRATKNMLGLKK